MVADFARGTVDLVRGMDSAAFFAELALSFRTDGLMQQAVDVGAVAAAVLARLVADFFDIGFQGDGQRQVRQQEVVLLPGEIGDEAFRQVFQRHCPAFTAAADAADPFFQFADVAGPGMGHQFIDYFIVEDERAGQFVLFSIDAEKILHQARDILAPFPKRRQDQALVKAVLEILGKNPGIMNLFVGGGDDAGVAAFHFKGADAADFAVVDEAQQSVLAGQGQIANFVEKEEAAAALADDARIIVRRAGEGAFFVAKEFGGDEFSAEGAAVEGDQRRVVCAVIEAPDCLGHDLFAGAAFAGDEHMGFGVDIEENLLLDVADRARRSDEFRDFLIQFSAAHLVRETLVFAVEQGELAFEGGRRLDVREIVDGEMDLAGGLAAAAGVARLEGLHQAGVGQHACAFQQHPAGGHGGRAGCDVDHLGGVVEIVLVEDFQHLVEHGGIDEIEIHGIGGVQRHHFDLCPGFFSGHEAAVLPGDVSIVGAGLVMGLIDEQKDLIDLFFIFEKNVGCGAQSLGPGRQGIVVADEGKVDHRFVLPPELISVLLGCIVVND